MAAADALDAARIAATLPGRLDVRTVGACGSTNAELLAEGVDSPALLVADLQTRGRGRRGRRWHSAAGEGLLMSLRHPVLRPLRELPALSLVAGVAAMRALRSIGVDGISLKWPNDLLVAGAKLGGILVETRSAQGRVTAVIGIGINWRNPPRAAVLSQDATCVASLATATPSRNAGAAAIARELLAALATFEREGLAAFRDDWEHAHAHAGRRVRVRLGGGRVMTGVAEGLAPDGSLRVRTRAGLRDVHSGTVRAA
jgi:BirA family biotin operon repressor/biotin-[acetyl-CoA-carboxylase] ligase